MAEIRLYNSITKPAKRILLLAALLAACFYVHHYLAVNWIIWVGCVLFGIPALLQLFHLADRRPKITLSTAGIYDKTLHSNVISWQVIRDAYALSVYGRQFICLSVNDTFKPADKVNIYKRVALFSKSLGAKELNLSLANMDVAAEKMASFIVQMKEANDIERERLLSAPPFLV